MKKYLKPMYLPYLTVILGTLGGLSMLWLYGTGEDARMLLNPVHPGAIIAWLAAAAMIAATVLMTRPLTGKMRYDRMFPRSVAGAAGTAIAGIGMLVTAFGELTSKADSIPFLCGFFGIVGGLCLGYLAWCRFAQIRPIFIARCIVLLYMMMHLLFRYQVWSAEPELLRYGFDLAATVCLLLATYQRCAIEVGMTQRRLYLCFSMIGAFFAMLALPGSADRVFLGCTAAWALTDLCSLRVRRVRKQEES